MFDNPTDQCKYDIKIWYKLVSKSVFFLFKRLLVNVLSYPHARYFWRIHHSTRFSVNLIVCPKTFFFEKKKENGI